MTLKELKQEQPQLIEDLKQSQNNYNSFGLRCDKCKKIFTMNPLDVSQSEIIVYNKGEEILATYIYYECPICKNRNIFYAEDDVARDIVEKNERNAETESKFRDRIQLVKQLVIEVLHAKETNTSGNREE